MKPLVVLPAILRQRWLFMLITATVLLLILIMQIINRRFWMHDFEVYYLAARAFVNGDMVYGRTYIFDTAFYKYSPFSLYFFVPLCMLPFGAAKVIFFLLISGATITTIVLAAQLLQNTLESVKRYGNGLLFITLGIVSSQVFRELHLGNVNMILLMIILAMLWFLLDGKQLTTGLLFALVLFIKPHFIILAPLLLLRKQYKTLVITLLALITGIFLPVLAKGFTGNLLLHKQWLLTMQNHNESLRQAYDNIYSLLIRAVPVTELSYIHISEKAVVITLLIIVATAFAWFVFDNIRQERKMQPQIPGRSFTIEFLILIALIPNLVITDSEHFLLSIPLILFLLGLLQNKTPLWFKFGVVTAILFYAMNIHDLVGTTVSQWLTHNGILGLGNLMIIGLTIYGFRVCMDRSRSVPTDRS